MTLVERAAEFAKRAHGDQKRKYTGEPYWYHLRNVAQLVATVPHTDDMLAAAWLHDVLEDTSTTGYRIFEEFGPVVHCYVYFLTDVSGPGDGNRQSRKKLDREHIGACPFGEVHTIKLADLIDNTASIVEHDKNFARVYLEEKAALLDALTRGDPTLRKLANRTLVWGQERLVQDALREGD